MRNGCALPFIVMRSVQSHPLVIALDPGGSDRLCDRRPPHLQVPPEHHLGGLLAVLGRQPRDEGVGQHLVPARGGAGGDGAGLAPGAVAGAQSAVGLRGVDVFLRLCFTALAGYWE